MSAMSRIYLALEELGYDPEEIDLEDLPEGLSWEKLKAEAGLSNWVEQPEASDNLKSP